MFLVQVFINLGDRILEEVDTFSYVRGVSRAREPIDYGLVQLNARFNVHTDRIGMGGLTSTCSVLFCIFGMLLRRGYKRPKFEGRFSMLQRDIVQLDRKVDSLTILVTR